MTNRDSDIDRWRVSRRAWLGLAGMGLGSGLASARAEAPGLSPEDEKNRDDALARAKEVGIGRLRLRTTAHFLALGNAADSFMGKATDIGESLLADYLEYFKARGFPVHPPDHRLVLVILSTPKEQLRFLGDDEDPNDAAPVFDPDAGRIVFFDLRAGGIKGQGARERGNTITLCHETSLLVMEKSGLLHPDADVPTSVREGLAGFLEFRPPTGRSPLGKPNPRQLALLSHDNSPPWIAVPRLIRDDKLFEEGATVGLAMAESWVLVDQLMRSPARLPGFLRYLEAINARRDPAHRLEDARAHLGDLDRLDKDLQTIAGQWRAYYDKLPRSLKPPRP
jgi:hypothetical protein